MELAEPRTSMVLELAEHNTDLRGAFEWACRYSTLSADELDVIGSHGMCLYLVNDSGGSMAEAERMLRFAQGLIDCGGLGVKVESAGKAHSRSDWAGFVEFPHLSVVDAFVTMAGEIGSTAYSCGMHNLGLPDASTPMRDAGSAGALLWTFCKYLAYERPVIVDGQTFGVAVGEPLYRLELNPCTRFDVDDLYHNPYGEWRLQPVGRG